MQEFNDEYRCIAADLRNANGGQSTGPLEIDRPWDAYADDQLGVMDHLGIDRFVVLGFCIGGPFIWNLLQRAPGRIVAAVLAQPSGSRPEMRELFYETGMAGARRAAARDHDGDGRSIPDQDVSHQSRFRLHRDARFRAQLPNASADPAGRYPAASLRGRHGGGDARAPGRGEPVSVEGAEGAHSARGSPDPFLPPGLPRPYEVRAVRRSGGGAIVANSGPGH